MYESDPAGERALAKHGTGPSCMRSTSSPDVLIAMMSRAVGTPVNRAIHSTQLSALLRCQAQLFAQSAARYNQRESQTKKAASGHWHFGL